MKNDFKDVIAGDKFAIKNKDDLLKSGIGKNDLIFYLPEKKFTISSMGADYVRRGTKIMAQVLVNRNIKDTLLKNGCPESLIIEGDVIDILTPYVNKL